jgi:hypothetical protein
LAAARQVQGQLHDRDGKYCDASANFVVACGKDIG